MKSYYILLSALFLIAIKTSGQDTICITGAVIDSKTKEALPFASIGVKGTHLGTISGDGGKFIVYLPDSLINNVLQVSYLGYRSFESSINKLVGKEQKIALQVAPSEIEAVVIRPQTPEQVIRLVIENIDKNYPQTPFVSEGFYREEFLENNNYTNFAEALVEVYSPSYNDTSNSMAKLIEGRTMDSLSNIKLLWDFAEKKYNKHNKKAKRKGKEFDTNEFRGMQIMFVGQSKFLLADVVRNKELFLDSTLLKKFEFEYKESTVLGDLNLMHIYCKTKKPIDHITTEADLYIDVNSYALVKFKSQSLVEIPLMAKPFMILYQIKVKDIIFNNNMEYVNVKGTWYPKINFLNIYADVIQKSGKKDECHSIFKGRQAFVATNTRFINIEPFKPEERLTNEKLSQQIKSSNPEFWKNKTIIDYSVK